MTKLQDQIIVIDLEATCWEGAPPPGQHSEIIEIGVCVLDVATCQRLDNPTIIVRPIQSRVSDHCTALTTLTQEEVDAGIPLADACTLLRTEYHSSHRIWASYGDYDRLKLEGCCRAAGIDYPFGSRHINVRSLFAIVHALRDEPSLDQAMEMMGWPLEGTLHRGGDDAWNIARLLGHILESARAVRPPFAAPTIHRD
jgi:inhibitor of KinA sporulation pathway (predicted exonuclease)